LPANLIATVGCVTSRRLRRRPVTFFEFLKSSLKQKRGSRLPVKIEMTLDRVSLHTIKGHFCSLLISNIFCNPHFLRSTFCYLVPTRLNTFFTSLKENTFVLLYDLFCKRRICGDFTDTHRLTQNLNLLRTLSSIFSVTPPCFSLPLNLP